MSERIKIERPKLLNRLGFYQVLDILDHYESEGNPLSIKALYCGLKLENSYYNAFYRIKNTLVKNGVVEIYDALILGKQKKMIRLTTKGRVIVLALKSLFQLLNSANSEKSMEVKNVFNKQ